MAEIRETQVLLLDDEAVALALRVGASWPTITQIAEVVDEVSLADAGRRGVGSLALRGLLTEDEDNPLTEPLRSLVEVVLAGRMVMSSFVAMDNGRTLTLTNSTLVYEHDGAWVTEVVSPVGAHYVMASSRESIVDQATAVASNFLSEEVSEEGSVGEDLFMVALGQIGPDGPSDAGVPAIRIRPGSVVTGTMRPEVGFHPSGDDPENLDKLIGSFVC